MKLASKRRQINGVKYTVVKDPVTAFTTHVTIFVEDENNDSLNVMCPDCNYEQKIPAPEFFNFWADWHYAWVRGRVGD